MLKQEIITLTAEFVKDKLAGMDAAHDWHHVYRVWNNAIHISQQENCDRFIVELGALLHDIADWKFTNGNEDTGPEIARIWLQKQAVESEIIEHVCGIIKDVSFKGAGVTYPMRSIEGMIVQDADRLDAMGAIGIARSFSYGGNKGRELYNPEIKPIMHTSFEEYKKSNSPTLNHFYEKLLLLKDRMNTVTAKTMATHRHKVMEGFLEEFLDEWNGEK